MCDIEVKVRDHLEEEGGAQVTGRKSEQADEGDERHGGSPPGFQIRRYGFVLLVFTIAIIDNDQIIPPWE